MDNGTLADTNIEYFEGYFATVMAVSGGYPGEYKKNMMISKFDDLMIEKTSIIFHAGTKMDAENNLETNGGRVITVTSQGNSIKEAVEKSKAVLSQIHFDGMYFRSDIGYEFE